MATPLGLNSIAGPWIENIQLSKGTVLENTGETDCQVPKPRHYELTAKAPASAMQVMLRDAW